MIVLSQAPIRMRKEDRVALEELINAIGAVANPVPDRAALPAE